MSANTATPSQQLQHPAAAAHSGSRSPLVADTDLDALVASLIVPAASTVPPEHDSQHQVAVLPSLRDRISPYLSRRLPYVCSDGHNHVGRFECLWGNPREGETFPMPLDPAKDDRRIRRAAGLTCNGPNPVIPYVGHRGRDLDAGEYPDSVELFIKKLKYTARDEYEAHKDELTEDERLQCELWIYDDSRWHLRWFMYKFQALEKEYDRLEAKWALDMTPGDRFALATEHYWLSLQLRSTAHKLRAVIMQTSPLHWDCWQQLIKARSQDALDAASAMCLAEIETLQDTKEPRPHDDRFGATNNVAADIEIFRVILIQIGTQRDHYNPSHDPALKRMADDANRELTMYMWRNERWTVLPPPFWLPSGY